MKRALIWITSALLLTACGLIGQAPAPNPTLDSDSLTRVAEAVAATSTARARENPATPTPKPTLSYLDLDEVILTADNLNVLLGIWPMTPELTSVPSAHPYCNLSCTETLWFTLDGKGTLQIDLFEFSNRGQVVEQLREIQNTQQVLEVRALSIPDDIALPTESWIQDNGGSGSRYTLHTRQGRALVILTMYLPEYDEVQNVLFLGLFAERQVELLAQAGW